VSPWVLRGLRDGVVTTRWPRRPDPYAESWRGPAVVLDQHPGGASDGTPDGAPGLAALCPAGAISAAPDGSVRLDQGQCIQCGRCVAERPDVFGWSHGPGNAALIRDRLVVPQIPETEPALAAARAALAARTAGLRRSVHLRHVDAGSDGAEEQEIVALLNPVYDIHRLGIFFTASPRHADVLLVTGAGAHGMAEPLRRTFEGMPSPKAVIAVGTDACGGGLLAGSYATSAGVGAVIPVDVWLPGSPPPPFSILHALLLALGRLADGRDR
jgi:Ni,Fe-hydrogenase III small subunit/ferredoxin